ncbi:MAG TPA: HAD family phosphatase [Candidatus Cybelea sp.]|nr:HAD family phosphatase [Candidatus Cybelea sp.]
MKTGENRVRGGDGRAKFRAIVLDYGAVLCHQPSPHEIERLAGVFSVTSEEFPLLYAGPRSAYDRGDLTTPEYWTEVARCAGVDLDRDVIENLSNWDKEMWSHVNTEMTDWLSAVRAAGYQTALLSNMQFDMIAHVRRHFAWLRNFDHQIFSAEVGAVKPERAIYLLCLDRLGARPSETLFIDDREENVAAARGLGIESFHFRSAPELRRELAYLLP